MIPMASSDSVDIIDRRAKRVMGPGGRRSPLYHKVSMGVLVGLLVGGALQAGAAGPPRVNRVAVVQMNLVGTAPALQEHVEQRLVKQLVAEGYTVQTPSSDLALGVCTVGPCLSRVGKAIGVDLVITGGVVAHGTSYEVVLTLLEVHGGTVVAQVVRRCDVCTFSEAGESVGRAVVALDRRARAYLDSHGWLVVQSRPRGAKVIVDGALLGDTPLTRLVGTGTRNVVVALDGHRPEGRSVTITSGQTTNLTPQLVSKGKRGKLDQQAFGSWGTWLKWAGLGVSLSTVAAGAALIAIHRECPGSPGCGESRETRIPGAAMVVTGTVAAAVTGYLLWRDHRQPKATHSAWAPLLEAPGVAYVRHF